jgi:hypothetical protein
MLHRANRITIIATSSVLLTAALIAGTAAAQKDSIPKVQNNLALGEDQVKQLLPLMTVDKQGKVSKQEYMHFMEAEFNRLDKDKSGQLDVKALSQPTLTARHYVGK